MGDTSIEWTDKTWNPTVGCSIVSTGCTNCYAMKMAHRIERMNKGKPSHYDGTTKVVNGNAVWTGVVNAAPDHILLQPLKWKKPARIFVNSMSDLFHESVPDEVIDRVFAVMALCPQHTFQILTKRSKRMRHLAFNSSQKERVERQILFLADSKNTIRVKGYYLKDDSNGFYKPLCAQWPLPNVHLGVSCEDQTRTDERIPDLLDTPAAVRFVSAEPLLGPIDFTRLANEWKDEGDGIRTRGIVNSLKRYNMPVINQIIVGGESGHGYRPMQIEWAEDIMRQCQETGTAYFFKQDSGPRSGMRGRASDELWACKQMPEVK